MSGFSHSFINLYGGKYRGYKVGMKTEIALSGKFYYQGKFQELTVGIDSGKISAIGKDITASRMLVLEGAIVPAATDTHVHFRDPGETEKEDFSSGSLSAIYGGTTTVFDMPNNLVPITDYERFENKLAAIRGRSYCDYGLYSMYNGNNVGVMSKLSNGVKIFLGGSTNSKGIAVRDQDIKSLNDMHVPMVFHAEDQDCLDHNKMEESDLRAHNLARPSSCERAAVDTALSLRLDRKAITHVSDYNSIPSGSEKNATYEVTPHHLLLNDSIDAGSIGKVNPPLRSVEVQRNLFQNYLDGKLDIVSSDHAPHTEYDKEGFMHAKSGIVGVETRVPLLLGLVSKHILDFDLFYRTAIVNPAKLFGLQKGILEVGYSADFMSFRMNNLRRINPERLHSKNPFSPFGHFEAVFPDSVMLRGEIILERGESVDDRLGQYIQKKP